MSYRKAWTRRKLRLTASLPSGIVLLSDDVGLVSHSRGQTIYCIRRTFGWILSTGSGPLTILQESTGIKMPQKTNLLKRLFYWLSTILEGSGPDLKNCIALRPRRHQQLNRVVRDSRYPVTAFRFWPGPMAVIGPYSIIHGIEEEIYELDQKAADIPENT